MKLLKNVEYEELCYYKEMYLKDKYKLSKINDLVLSYRNNRQNIFTVMRDIFHVLKEL